MISFETAPESGPGPTALGGSHPVDRGSWFRLSNAVYLDRSRRPETGRGRNWCRARDRTTSLVLWSRSGSQSQAIALENLGPVTPDGADAGAEDVAPPSNWLTYGRRDGGATAPFG